MELRFVNIDPVSNSSNDNVSPYTKESRLTRQQTIERNNFYHKKNPKSMKYHQQLAQQTSSPLSTQETKSTITAELKKELVKEVVDNHPPMKAKLKNQLQMMYQNLAKIMKKDGIFLETSSQYEHINVMKDYNVQIIGLKNKKIPLSVRACVGQWDEFRAVVLSSPQNFAQLKSAFTNWLNQQLIKYDASESVQEVYDQMLKPEHLDPTVERFLPQLEQKLLQVWKKPTKQPHGFIARAQQVFEVWNQEAQEINHIEQIESALNLQSYEQTFPIARSLKRKFTIFIGPTNSGKTHAALNELAKGKTGVYLAPLRLMAAEGQEALFERAVLANLVTGEEQQLHKGATHTSSTVEMCQLSKIVDVAVIDEIQMIADPARGWAWSQAMIGVSAKHVVLVGSEEALPFIIPVIEALGEPYEIKNFERKTPLNAREPLWRLQDLRPGDCVVVFSRKSALEMKNSIEATGKKCSVIYGNLSPEVRRAEAAKFKSGENPILVATDAIGMGLNLPIQRLFFSTLEKFDGINTRVLTISEIKQIAGRAGRYGLSQGGEVGIIADDTFESKNLLSKAIYQGYERAHDTRVPIAPNLEQIKTICDVLGKEDLYSALIFFKEKLIRNHDYYKAANLESMIEIAGLIKTKNLDLATGLNYSCVPIDLNSDLHVKSFYKWLNNHQRGNKNIPPSLPEVVTYAKTDSYSLYEAENYVKLCMAYRWLHYKYPESYPDIEVVSANARTTNDYIEKALHKHIVISKNPKWRR